MALPENAQDSKLNYLQSHLKPTVKLHIYLVNVLMLNNPGRWI